MDLQTDASARSVLFVDDDEYVIKALVRLMRPTRYRILTALNGADALAILEADPGIDVIVSDSLAPPINGIKLIRMAKQMCPAIVPIILSGKSDLADVQRAKSDGVLYAFIPKPWHDGDLIATIRQAFADSAKSGI